MMKRAPILVTLASTLVLSGCFGIFGGPDRGDDRPDAPCGECGGINTGRVDLQGLSVQLTDVYTCWLDAAEVDCGDYVVRFTLENGTELDVAELNQVEMASATTVIARTPFETCVQSTHTPGAHRRSDVIQVDLSWGSTDTSTAWSYFCGDSFRLEPAAPAPAVGEVAITVRGILADASTFEATAVAAIQDVAP